MSTNPQTSYDRIVNIIKKGQSPIEGPTLGNIVNGDLDEYVLKVSVTNATTDEVNSMKLDLRIDPVGTFIRDGPILVDEIAKDRYLIDVKYIQTLADGTVRLGRQYRFEISQAIILDDEVNGEILQVIGRGEEYILKENLDGSPLFLQAPADAFQSRLFNYAGNPHSEFSGNNPFGNSGRNVTIDLIQNDLPASPDFDSLKRDWIPSGPQPIFAHLKEIIDKVALPAQVGGTLTDFYWDALPNENVAGDVKIIVTQFGGVDSGVVIDPEEFEPSEQKDKQLITDSKRIKNQVILKGQRGAGSLPMGHVRFNSLFTNSRFRPDWDPNLVEYLEGAQVKRIGDSVTDDRFWKAKIDHFSSIGVPPESGAGSILWEEDFKIDDFTAPNGTDVENHLSQWTRSTFDWITNLARPTLAGDYLDGANPVATDNADSGYVGYCVDWNFVRGNYDRDTFTNFDHISIKWVTRISNAPPTSGETHDGQRILVGTSPVGVFAGHADQVAEFDAFPDNVKSGESITQPARWRFSRDAQDGDIVSDMSTGIIMQYNGSWTRFWTLEDHPVQNLFQAGDSGAHSWFHLVKEIGKVEGPSGSDSAIRFIYDWRVGESSVDGGNQLNRTSRGVWMNFWFPFPRLNTGAINFPGNEVHENIGHEYGGIGTKIGTMDLLNLTNSSLGLRGWNQGLASEDMGTINALKFKFKVRWETGLPTTGGGGPNDRVKSLDDGTLAVAGYNDEKFICFFVDKFDRVAQFDFTQRRNGGWTNVTVPIGAFGNYSLYVNRIDEIQWFFENEFGKAIDILSAVGQRNDWRKAEKEFTGATFDWRAVKMWGIQWASPYGAMGNYIGHQFSSIQDNLLSAVQAGFDTTENNSEFVDSLVDGVAGPVVGTIIKYVGPALGVGSISEGIVDLIKTVSPQLQDIDRVTADIDEIRFVKDLYANSDQERVDRARTHAEYRESEFDYLSARRASEGVKARLEFYPQNYTITSFGDVRVRVGELVTITGEKVPTLTANHPLTGQPLPPNTQVGAVKSVTHTIDQQSYSMRIELVRKFILGT